MIYLVVRFSGLRGGMINLLVKLGGLCSDDVLKPVWRGGRRVVYVMVTLSGLRSEVQWSIQ